MADSFSNKPWSSFKESDYTPEQWKRACLIVRGDGSTKAQCSLPVREPDGTVNKNALSAAAGALAGARGGVNATPEEKAKASAALRRLYSAAGMVPPPSLKHTALSRFEDFLTAQGLGSTKLMHFGVKGQKWGFRRSDAQLASAAKARADAPDAVRAKETLAAIRAKGSLTAVSDADLNHLVNRLNTEKRYAEIDPSTFEKGHKAIKTTLDVGRTMNEAIKFANSPAGHLLARSLGLTKSTGRHTKTVSDIIKAAGGKKVKKK